MNRRRFLQATALLAGAPLLGWAESARPWVVSGDVRADRAVVVSGGGGAGRLQLEWSTSAEFRKSRTVAGSWSNELTGYTARAELEGLPPGATVYYKATFGGGKPGLGRFRTPPTSGDQSVTFLWGGDVAGQGWGIDPARGGMKTFQSMLKERPDFFIHGGDTVYADGPLSPHIKLDDGSVWHNLVTPAKAKVAGTLDDYRGNHDYNLLDPHYRKFFSQVSVLAQWDDHDVFNNWEPEAHEYLATPALKAFLEHWPVRSGGRLYRKVSYGPNLDVFVLDLRSYRAPNSDNRQRRRGEPTRMLGDPQLQWLKRELAESKATWKVIAGEMPIATVTTAYGLDSWANGVGPPLGREFELAELLGFLKRRKVSNVVWFSADVHYALAVEFLPQKAVFKDFDPFWEFVAGPLHAGTFCPSEPLDNTFGAQERFCAVPKDLKPNRPPSDNLQFYGKVEVGSQRMGVSLHDRLGRRLYKKVLQAR